MATIQPASVPSLAIGGVIIIIFVMEGERIKREMRGEFLLNHSFPDFDFHWARSVHVAMESKNNRELLACILQLKKFREEKMAGKIE